MKASQIEPTVFSLYSRTRIYTLLGKENSFFLSNYFTTGSGGLLAVQSDIHLSPMTIAIWLTSSNLLLLSSTIDRQEIVL